MLVVLVAFAQLVAFLALHLWNANTSMREQAELLVRKMQAENRLVTDAAIYRVIRLDRDARADAHCLRATLAGVQRPNECGLEVINSRDGSTFCHLAPDRRLASVGTDPADTWSWTTAGITSINTSGNVTVNDANSTPMKGCGSLLNRIKQTGDDSFQCYASDCGSTRAISARRIPQSDYCLLIYFDCDEVVNATFDQSFYTASNIGFAVILLVGLGSCGLMLSLLTRYGDKVSEIGGQLTRQIEERTCEIAKTQNAVIFGLAKLAESRDNDTGDHLDRIRLYVTILASDLSRLYPDIDTTFIANLELASSLHDIGKVGIPDSILLKPGRLSVEERDVMEIHTVIGGECLHAIESRLGNNEFMTMAREVAYSHHERWDGTGYPYGLSGDAIPLVARIVSVADVYDALTSKRPYKRAMSHLESREIIVKGKGTQFDPQVVDAFLRHEDEFLEISIEQQSLSDEDAIAPIQRLSIAASDSKPDLLIPQVAK